MAIQKINLGTEPLGEGGDNYRSANSKINENFSNTSHAASRLVGTKDGQIPTAEQVSSLLGTASTKNVGTGAEEVPQNKNLGTVATKDIGTANGQVPTSEQVSSLLGTAATKDVGTEDGQVATWQTGRIVGTKKDSNTNLILESGDSIPNNSAASRLVVGNGSVMSVGTFGIGDSYLSSADPLQLGNTVPKSGLSRVSAEDLKEGHPSEMSGLVWSWHATGLGASIKGILADKTGYSDLYYYSWFGADRAVNRAGKIYTELNTTKDTVTGFLKASSSVLHVYNDSITKIHEAEQLDITVDKKGVGHYEIHGTTGLRKDGGWFMSPPRDVHGNVLCMVDLDEKDGVIILKTYNKLFDFEAVSIVPDYDNPMDIPKDQWVDLHLNDITQEYLEEPEPAEEPEEESK